jgi:hypothetical protein
MRWIYLKSISTACDKTGSANRRLALPASQIVNGEAVLELLLPAAAEGLINLHEGEEFVETGLRQA